MLVPVQSDSTCVSVLTPSLEHLLDMDLCMWVSYKVYLYVVT